MHLLTEAPWPRMQEACSLLRPHGQSPPLRRTLVRRCPLDGYALVIIPMANGIAFVKLLSSALVPGPNGSRRARRWWAEVDKSAVQVYHAVAGPGGAGAWWRLTQSQTKLRSATGRCRRAAAWLSW